MFSFFYVQKQLKTGQKKQCQLKWPLGVAPSFRAVSNDKKQLILHSVWKKKFLWRCSKSFFFLFFVRDGVLNEHAIKLELS